MKYNRRSKTTLALPFSLYTVSDLHLETFNTQDEKALAASVADFIPATEVLVLAGDVGWPGTESWEEFLRICGKKHSLVVYVLGNHELWSKERTRATSWTPEEIELQCAKFNVVVLNNSSMEYRGVTFVGSTLWTPLLSIDGSRLADTQVAPMNDLRRITGFTPAVWRTLFKQSFSFLVSEMDFLQAAKKPCVIVTHHAPSFECIGDKYRGDEVNGCYASELLSNVFDLSFVKAWIFGHTHKTMRVAVGKRKNTLLCGHSARDVDYGFVLDEEHEEKGMLSTGPGSPCTV